MEHADRELLETSLDHHTKSLDFDKKSVIDSLRVAIAGGAMVGAGAIGFAEGIVLRDLRIILPSAGVAFLGRLLAKDSVSSIRKESDYIAEEQARVTTLQQSLSELNDN
ncbi:MAG: hypothetical protein Q7R60_00785 [bacterium]|nr:hypothetical protein [bacterium]